MPRITILMYHIIDKPGSKKEKRYCCLPENFKRQMEYLKNSEYTLVNLNDISEILTGKKEIKSDCVAVTFDDGFKDFFINAYPVLNQFKIPATLFMVADRLAQTNDWMQNLGAPERDLLNLEQLIEVSNANVLIGSHTSTHAKLNEISSNDILLKAELLNSKQKLEKKLNKPVEHLAYPNGLYDENVVSYCQKIGYKTACTTHSGFNQPDKNPLLLHRIEVFFDDSLWQFKQKLKFGTNDMPITFPLKYYMKRLKQKLM